MRTDKTIAYIVSHTNHSLQWEWFLDEMKDKLLFHFIIIDNTYENYLYESLKQKGFRVTLLVYKNKISYIIILFKLISYIIKNKIDIVQTEMPLGNLLGLTSAFLSFRKRIMTASNVTWYKDFNSKKQYIIDKISYFLANKIICQEESSYKILEHEFNINKNKLSVIHHAVNPKYYLHIPKNEIDNLKIKYNINENEFIFGMISRLEYWKGHIYPIKAMQKIVQKFPHTKLLIFGEGPEKENLHNLINSLELNNYVFLCGFEKNIIPLYKIFNVQIHTPIDPYCETFGITILDAMMSELPMILTLSGIAKSIAKHKENAWIVPFKDTLAIEEAMDVLISDESLRILLGFNARKTVMEKFSIEQKIQSHLDIYNSL